MLENEQSKFTGYLTNLVNIHRVINHINNYELPRTRQLVRTALHNGR